MLSESDKTEIKLHRVVYIAQSYSKLPEKAYTNAVRWTALLLDKGYFVFSPILHTHNFYVTGKEWCYNSFGERSCDRCGIQGDCTTPECIAIHNIEKLNFVNWDLQLLRKFVPNRVTMAFAEDCIIVRGVDNWEVDLDKSKGAKEEYNFARIYKFQIVRLSELLEG